MSWAFLVPGQPPTANKELRPSGRRFLAALRHDHAAQGAPRLAGLLCGRITWFVPRYDAHRHPDADNISKKIWDADGLGSIAYADDQQVRLRAAAILDLAGLAAAEDGAPGQLDLSTMPERLMEGLDRLLQSGDAEAAGFAYIELGYFRPGLLRFGDLALWNPPR